VQGHPGGLHRRRAVAGDRGARHRVEPEQHRHHPGQVVALFAAGQAAAQHQVVDLGRVERGHLIEGRADHLDGQVVGTHVDERTLAGTADRRPGRRDDHCLGH
jgi:hypothetical protein